MLRALINRRLDAEERRLGVSLGYLRHIAEISLSAFFKFGLFMPLAQHRSALPSSALAVARLVATRSDDCGACVQTEVNLALEEGVDSAVVRSVLEERPEELEEGLAEVYRFAEAVVRIDWSEGELRERLRQRYGESGLVDLASGDRHLPCLPDDQASIGLRS